MTDTYRVTRTVRVQRGDVIDVDTGAVLMAGVALPDMGPTPGVIVYDETPAGPFQVSVRVSIEIDNGKTTIAGAHEALCPVRTTP